MKNHLEENNMLGVYVVIYALDSKTRFRNLAASEENFLKLSCFYISRVSRMSECSSCAAKVIFHALTYPSGWLPTAAPEAYFQFVFFGFHSLALTVQSDSL